MLFLSLLLLSCAQTPVREAVSNNPNVPVAVLFVHDGCTVYRFYDGSRRHYFAKCVDATAETMTIQGCGKNCSYPENVPTKSEQ